jgi:hypothetical protein
MRSHAVIVNLTSPNDDLSCLEAVEDFQLQVLIPALYSEMTASLQASATLLPRGSCTSMWRSLAIICSGVNLLFGMGGSLVPGQSSQINLVQFHPAKSQDAFGASQGEVYSEAGNLREKVTSGENLIGISAIGPYALQWPKENPTLGVALLSDYSPAFRRVPFVNKAAPHPNAARLFFDFMVPEAGQEALASPGLPSDRSDTTVGENAETLSGSLAVRFAQSHGTRHCWICRIRRSECSSSSAGRKLCSVSRSKQERSLCEPLL